MALLIGSALIMLVVLAVKALRNPTPRNPGQSYSVFFAREAFHTLLGSTFLILLLSDFVTPVITLAVSAVLLIGFEYSIVIVRKLRS